ncbi:MAG TPA: hypothetical protein VMC85_21950 [Desulfomonilaceae bacterium]|nr:hypothetical protein [Desulfomonilaceae bacterium]
MTFNNRNRPAAPAQCKERSLHETICDSATNSFLPRCSYPMFSGSETARLPTIFDRRVFLLALAASPFSLVYRGPKQPIVRQIYKTAMFARRI